MKSVREIVEAEIAEYKKEYREDWQIYYFNNFGFNLPDDEYENGTYYLDIAARLGRLDQTPAEMDPENKQGFSDKYRNQTAREFFEAIKQVLEEQRISLEEVKKLQHLRNEEGSQHWERLYDLVLPAYLALREKGYQRYPDLIR